MKNVICGGNMYAKHIYRLADHYRKTLKALLKKPYENKCICVSFDIRTDPYKQISHAGISISFVDEINLQVT